MIIWLASYPKSGNTWVDLSGFFTFYKGRGSDLSNLNLKVNFH